MTLNGEMAIILRYFAEFGRFHGQFHTSGWLAVVCLREMSQSTPTKHDGRAVLFAVAELLVSMATTAKAIVKSHNTRTIKVTI